MANKYKPKRGVGTCLTLEREVRLMLEVAAVNEGKTMTKIAEEALTYWLSRRKR